MANGYADPNILIPLAIESVQTDGGAFNVREGNNAVNGAMIFGLRDRIASMTRITGDYRDVNLVTGLSPANPSKREWVGLELSYGNGFLKRLEHRKQYKINASRAFNLGRHDLTIYGIGYHGFSFLPGLAPIDTVVPNDTVDARQFERASIPTSARCSCVARNSRTKSIGDLNRVFYPRPIWEFGKGVTEDPIGAAGYPLSACTGVFQVAQTWKQRAMRFEPLE